MIRALKKEINEEIRKLFSVWNDTPKISMARIKMLLDTLSMITGKIYTIEKVSLKKSRINFK